MSPVFLDTSFLLALVLADDALHARALAWQAHVRAPLITSEYVLLELADALAASAAHREAALRAMTGLRADSVVEIVPASTVLMARGLAFFRDRPDKQWGLTDCISFVIMQGADAIDALTYDHHFEQAGYHALLRSDPPSGS